MTTDLDLRRGDSLFRFRVCAVCLENGSVLLQQIAGTDYWFLPGGCGQLMETSEDSLRRELREELDAEAEVVRLLWVAENFFTLGGTAFHEVGLYFLVKLAAGTPILERDELTGLDNDTLVLNRWHDLNDLDGLRLVPDFLTRGLRNLPGHPAHLVHRDARTD